MKKLVAITLFAFTCFTLFSQSFPYFKSLGLQQMYLNGTSYILKYKTETNFMGTVTAVSYDTIYIQKVLELSEQTSKRHYQFEKKNKEISDALEYSNMIYSDNSDFKSKSAQKIKARITFYKSLLSDAKNKYEERQNNLLLTLAAKQDSIELIKQKEKSKLELSIERKNADQDSMLNQKRKNFLNPSYICNTIGIGMPNSLKDNIERNLEINIAAHRGGVDFYDLGDVFMGLRYGGQSMICIEISFRLFGDEAKDYESLLKKKGFILKSKKKTTNLELESDMTSQLLDGELRVYGKNDVICKVMDGSFISFTFYRGK